MGRYDSKSCRLAVGGLPVRSQPGRVEVSLRRSKTPNPQLLLMSWLVPYMAANRRWCVNVCVNGWMRGINCTALWIKALYKCSPFYFFFFFFIRTITLGLLCSRLSGNQLLIRSSNSDGDGAPNSICCLYTASSMGHIYSSLCFCSRTIIPCPFLNRINNKQ